MSSRHANVDAKSGSDIRSQSSASSYTAVEKSLPEIVEGLGLHCYPVSPTIVHADAAELDHRWSEVIPPETALTFGAVWDPVEGLVTFSGATLSTCSECGHRFEAPDIPTLGTKIMPPASRRELAEPSINFADVDGRSQVLTIDRFAMHGASVPNTATLTVQDDSLLYPYPRFMNSNVSAYRVNGLTVPHSPARCSSAGTSGVLDNFINGRDANALRRRPSQQKHSRASRYGFLSSNPAGNASSLTVERLTKAVLANSTPKSTASPLPLRSLFADSCWNRSAPKLSLRMDELACDNDAAVLELNDDPAAGEEWLGYLDDEEQELDLHFDPQMGNLKSAFSWTTTSTSRYIDVAAFLLEAAEESDASSHTESGERAGPCPSGSGEGHDEVSLSEWSSIEPPSPPSGAWRREMPRISNNRRKLHKPKPIVIPPRPQAADVVSIYQCNHCHHRMSRSVPNTISAGQGHKSSRSSSTRVSSTIPAPAAEVLARESYNHEWPVPSDEDSILDYYAEAGSYDVRREDYVKRTPSKACLSDVKDVLKGMKTAVPWMSSFGAEIKASTATAASTSRARSLPRAAGRLAHVTSEPGPSHVGGYRISSPLQRSSTQGHTTRTRTTHTHTQTVNSNATTASSSQTRSATNASAPASASRRRRLSLSLSTPNIHLPLPSVRVLPANLNLRDQRWAKAISGRLGSLHDSIHHAPLTRCRRSGSASDSGHGNSIAVDDDAWVSVDYEADVDADFIPPVPPIPPQFAQTAY